MASKEERRLTLLWGKALNLSAFDGVKVNSWFSQVSTARGRHQPGPQVAVGEQLRTSHHRLWFPVFRPVLDRTRQDSSKMSVAPYYPHTRSAETNKDASGLGQEKVISRPNSAWCWVSYRPGPKSRKRGTFNSGSENQNPFSRINTPGHTLGPSTDTGIRNLPTSLDFSMTWALHNIYKQRWRQKKVTVKKKRRWCFKPKAEASSLSHGYACVPMLHVHTQNICTYSTFSLASLIDEYLETSKIKDKTKCVIRIIWKQVCRAQRHLREYCCFFHTAITH